MRQWESEQNGIIPSAQFVWCMAFKFVENVVNWSLLRHWTFQLSLEKILHVKLSFIFGLKFKFFGFNVLNFTDWS